VGEGQGEEAQLLVGDGVVVINKSGREIQ